MKLNETQKELLKELDEKCCFYELADKYGDDSNYVPEKQIILLGIDVDDELWEKVSNEFDVFPEDEFVVINGVVYRFTYYIDFIPKVWYDEENCEWKVIKDSLREYVSNKVNKLEACNIEYEDILDLDLNPIEERKMCDGFCDFSIKKDKLLEEIKSINEQGRDVIFTVDYISQFRTGLTMWSIKKQEQN